jgi:hypothetical protein
MRLLYFSPFIDQKIAVPAPERNIAGGCSSPEHPPKSHRFLIKK